MQRNHNAIQEIFLLAIQSRQYSSFHSSLDKWMVMIEEKNACLITIIIIFRSTYNLLRHFNS